MRNLPPLARPGTKLRGTLFVGLVTVLIYGIAGRIAAQMDPSELALSALDQRIGLLPWTFWVYSSVYFIYFTSCALQREMETFNKFLWGYLFAYASSAFFFVAFPTTFPRDQFPLPVDASFTSSVFSYFRSIDLPTNCFPSMHVASCVMATMPFYKRRPAVFLFFCAWSAAIAITTLTTKQHYALDVLAGAAFGVFANRIAFRLLPTGPDETDVSSPPASDSGLAAQE